MRPYLKKNRCAWLKLCQVKEVRHRQTGITLCLFTRGSLNIDVEAQSQLAEARQGSVETAQQHVGGRPTQLH